MGQNCPACGSHMSGGQHDDMERGECIVDVLVDAVLEQPEEVRQAVLDRLWQEVALEWSLEEGPA